LDNKNSEGTAVKGELKERRTFTRFLLIQRKIEWQLQRQLAAEKAALL
jgi:hypothetical protein